MFGVADRHSHPVYYCFNDLGEHPVLSQQAGQDSKPDSFCTNVSGMETRSAKLSLRVLIEKSQHSRRTSPSSIRRQQIYSTNSNYCQAKVMPFGSTQVAARRDWGKPGRMP